MDTRTGAIKTEFADGDAHAAGPEVAQSQDTTAVGNHDDLDIVMRPVI